MRERGIARLRSAFTLIEMLGVLFLVSLILGPSVRFYFDITDKGQRATERVRRDRRAVAILDRVARDLEHATLVVKPAEMDPLDHPWLFLAEEGRGEIGAERVKFIRRGTPARSSASSVSDLAVVSYAVRDGEAGDLALWRQVVPGLPEELDRSFGSGEDNGALLLADGLARFGFRFLDDEGEWKNSWDSSQLVDSSQLPRMVEIGISMAAGEDEGAASLDAAPDFSRRVMLPLRPVDLEAVFDAAAAGQADEDAECVTIGQCLADRPEVREIMSLDDEQLVQLAGTCVTDLDRREVERACLE